MAYLAYTITNVNEVPALVGTFAAAQGFTVDSTDPNAPILTHPSYVSAEPFQFSYSEATPGGGSSTSNCYRRISIAAVNPGVMDNTCVVECPRLWNGASNVPLQPAPTKLHMFGGLTPEPYIAGVIEFGYNLYRHFYFGYAEKLSSYEGGEIVTASAIGAADSSSPSYNTQYSNPSKVAFPFSSASTYWASPGGNGGMRIVHANNPVSWRKFYRTGSGTSSFLSWLAAQPVSSLVFGGFRDSINTGYLYGGRSPFSGQNVLAPINLYLGNKDGTVQAVGRPAGVRLVNMQDLDPGAEITIGSTVWRVFPIFAKSTNPYLNSRNDPAASSGASWYAAETSYLVGQAYLVSE